MGLCPPWDLGCNVCEGYPRDPHDPIWVGMFDIQAGQLEQVGCAPGCIPCVQQELNFDFLRPEGNRWMRAHQPIVSGHTMLPNRLANGMVGDLQSIGILSRRTRTRRVPEEINFHRGVCYQNLWEGEAFGDDGIGANACDCDIPPDTALNVGDLICDGGEGPGEPVEGAFPDDFFYSGQADLSALHFFCRRIEEVDSRNQHVTSVNLFPPTFLRTSQCGSNMFLQCTRKGIAGSPCFEFESSEFLDRHHQAFNFVPVQFNDFGLKEGSEKPDFPYADEALDRFKSITLNSIDTLPGLPVGFRFEQLDHAGRTGTGPTTIWNRFYGGPGNVCSDFPKIPFDFGACYLKHTRASVRVEAFISKATIEAWISAQHVNETPIGLLIQRSKEKIYPHVRVRVRLQVSYRATLLEDASIVENWWHEDHPDFGKETQLRILNAGDPDYPTPGTFCQYPAIVAPIDSVGGTAQDPLANQPDRIICTDEDGVEFEIPNRVEWWGYMGVRESDSVWIYDPGGPIDDLAYPCCRLLKSMNGLEVRGIATLIETKGHNEVALYKGAIKFNFAETTSFNSLCVEGEA